MSGGMINDAHLQPILCESAISKKGTLLTFGSVAESCKVCGAGEKPIGYAFVTTINRLTNTAEANKTITLASLTEGEVVDVPLLATNAEIAIGNELETTALGTVDKLSGAGEVVGSAWEAKAANSGGYIRVRVSKRVATA